MSRCGSPPFAKRLYGAIRRAFGPMCAVAIAGVGGCGSSGLDVGDAAADVGDAGEAEASCYRAERYLMVWSKPGGATGGAAMVRAIAAGKLVRASGPEDEGWVPVEGGVIEARFASKASCDAPDLEPNIPPGSRRVLAIVFDPTTAGDTPIRELYSWHDPLAQIDETIAYWESVTDGTLTYRVHEVVIRDEFPVKIDGFRYTAEQYREVVDSGGETAHSPDQADYELIAAADDVCVAANAGLVDEVWLNGGPWFGYYESAFFGPGEAGYPFNGPTFSENECERLIPVMGFNYQRSTKGVGHIWGHRTEATFTHLYCGWEQDRMDTPWERFGLTYAQSPTLNLAGCGSIHWPPTATFEYHYDGRNSVPSMCHDFRNFPFLGDPYEEAVEISCDAWGCNEWGFYAWWFQHLPRSGGHDLETGIAHDWLAYVVDPHSARSCASMSPDECAVNPRCTLTACDTCIARGADEEAACSTCGRQQTVEDCDATDGCAWYSCAVHISCWPRGTLHEDACSC